MPSCRRIRESGLSSRALVLDRADRAVDLSITLAKRIPLGAGLGGGSSDAAATILGLTRLLGLDWPVERMTRDRPTIGQRRALLFLAPPPVVTGRGERVRPVQVDRDPVDCAREPRVSRRNEMGLPATFRQAGQPYAHSPRHCSNWAAVRWWIGRRLFHWRRTILKLRCLRNIRC